MLSIHIGSRMAKQPLKNKVANLLQLVFSYFHITCNKVRFDSANAILNE